MADILFLGDLQCDLQIIHRQEIGQPRKPAQESSRWSMGLSLPLLRKRHPKLFPRALAHLPSPFGGCLLCELMTVIITALSSFVISYAKPRSGGSGLFFQIKVFIKQIAV